MQCHQLAARIQQLEPEAAPRDIARLCLLLANAVENLADLADEHRLGQAWQAMGIRLQAASDQHAAMTADLEALASAQPMALTTEQVRVLIRAIRVQSQILQLYLGRPPVEA